MKLRSQCILLLVAFSLLCPASTFAENTAGIDSHAVGLLEALEVISPDIAMAEPVTRAEFAAMLYRLTPVSESKTNGRLLFSDVLPSSAVFAEVSALTEMGILSADGERLFRPEDPITYHEAVKMLVCAAGYEFIAREHGGYPTGYLFAAAGKKLTAGIAPGGDSPITNAQAIGLLFQLMNCDVSDTNSVDGISNGAKKEPYMEKRLRIVSVQGIVTDNGTTSLYGESGVRRNCLVIDGDTYINGTGRNDLLGLSVTAYYKTEDKAEETVFFVHEDSKNEITVLNDRDICSYSNGTYQYDSNKRNGRSEHLKTSPSFCLIYNSYAMTENDVYTDAVMVPVNGLVRAIDNNGDGAADVVFVNSYRTIVTGSVGDETIYDVNGGAPVVLKNCESYTVCDESGFSYSLAAIDLYQVLTVAQSLDGRHCTVTVSAKNVQGKVTEISEDGYTIGDVVYRADNCYSGRIKVGDEGTFYLSQRGDIAYFKRSADSDAFYAYLINARVDQSIDSKLLLDIYTDRNLRYTASCADKIKVDGTTYRDASTALDLLKDADAVQRQILRLYTNGDNQVYQIDTVEKGNEEETDSLYIMSTAPIAHTQLTIQTLYYELAVYGAYRNDTPFFRIPSPFDPEQLSVVYGIDMTEWSRNFNDVVVYGERKDSPVAGAVSYTVKFSGADLNCGEYLGIMPGMVRSVSDAIKADGTLCKKMRVLQSDGTTKEILTADEDSLTFMADGKEYTISEGDIIRCGYDKRNEAIKGNIDVYYDADRKWYDSDVHNANVPLGYDFSVGRAWVYDIKDKYMLLSTKDPSKEMVLESECTLYPLESFRSYYTYDVLPNGRAVLEIASSSSIVTYQQSAQDCSEVLYTTNYGRPQMMILYR